MVQYFYSKLESVLQSSKFDNLKLNDPFNLQIKLLGEEHMKHLREKQEKELHEINMKIPNYGSDEIFQDKQNQGPIFKLEDKPYFFQVPKTLGQHQSEMEQCFKSNCLILSIIIGKVMILIIDLLHPQVSLILLFYRCLHCKRLLFGTP